MNLQENTLLQKPEFRIDNGISLPLNPRINGTLTTQYYLSEHVKYR